jgi:hypothetical protein
MMEKWRLINDTGYEVSDIGNIRRFAAGINTYKGRPKKTSESGNGYLIFGAFKHGKRTNILVHRAVAEAFIGTIPKNKEVNHKDGNKMNNIVSNLEIVTRSENATHAVKMGLWDMAALYNSKKHYGDDHWSHKKPWLLARGDNNGSRRHPESILKGEQCHASKLTETDVTDIRYQYFGGMAINTLAEIYMVSNRNVWSIVNNRSWRHCL